MTTQFLDLPDDLHLIFFLYLDIGELIYLAETCKRLYKLVHEHGWGSYRRLKVDEAASPSMRAVYPQWTDKTCAVHLHLADRAWQRRRFKAQALCTPWPAIFHPVMATSPSRMAVVAGNALLTFAFGKQPRYELEPSNIALETRVALPHATSRDGKRDLIGASFIPDREGQDRTLIVALGDGTVERLYLPAVNHAAPAHDPSRVVRTGSYERGPKGLTALATSGQLTAVLSRSGSAALYRANAPWQRPSLLTLPGTRRGRSWCVHFAPDASYVAFGRSHVDAPLALHAIHPDGDIALDYTSLPGAPPGRGAAVYAMANMTPHVLLSGWFDGNTRAYDTRAPPTAGPTLVLRDPWTPDAIYSVAAAGNKVAAGTARHGMTALFDVRMPRGGWSVYAPGRAESSPVYGLALEDARVFGLTRTRAFVVDFSPGARNRTFPELGGEARVQPRVIHYEHAKGR
ncbi:hypothetical protein AURDEDRAFT_150960 [Auricularia subglabra TFB-10046 SS5]|nr:hypothetical protein AURDEDRAFT_150960 [Auricularia subglabra TFB-10046 SS5]